MGIFTVKQKDLTGQTNKNAPVKGVDLDAQGTINDVPTYDFDLQSIKDEDKPWRKPGADITDYFNYGFTEESWIGYCAKQKRLRSEIMTNKILINPSGHPFMGGQSMGPQMGMNQPQMMGNLSQQNGGLVMQQPMHYGIQNKMPFIRPAPMQMIGQQQQQPPQQPRKIGVIDVIGTTDSTSRRPQYDMDAINPIGVVGSQSQMPDMSAPPPGWQTQIRLPQQQQQPRMPIIFQNPFSQYGRQGMQMDRPFPQNPAPFIQPPQFLRHQQQQWEKPITVDSGQYFNEPTSPKSRTRSPTPNKSPTHSKSPKEDKYKHRYWSSYLLLRYHFCHTGTHRGRILIL
jgi:pre-mRNA 3'-end-processing factor FIP1